MEMATGFQNFNSILLVVLISMWLYWLWTRRHLYYFSLKFPGSWGLPLLGLFYRVTSLEDFHYIFPKLFAESKLNTICVWLGIYPVLFTQDPEFIEKVLSSPDLLNKSKGFYQPLYKAFDGGIIASPVEKWQHNRKLINPSFNHKVLLSFFPTFHKAKKLALSKFDVLVGQGEHKLLDMLQRISLGISYETTMGKVMLEGDEVDEDITRKVQYLAKQAMKQIIYSLLNLDTILSFTNFQYRKTITNLKKITNKLILEKIEISEKIENNQTATEAVNYDQTADVSIKKTSNIFIDQAIRLYKNKQFTWLDIRSETNTIVAASFETSANSTFAALVMLAMHPEVQEKLYQEIVSVFPEKNFEMEYSHIEQLPYLDMVINEVLRVNPSVPIIGRHVVKETQLSKDVILPKDLQIAIPIFHLHRRTDIWGPNAEQFNPDNFLPENIRGKHPYAYMPFSKGKRNCIGWRYALFAMKVLIAGFVRNFRFTTTFEYKNLRYTDKVALCFVEEPPLEIYRR